MRIRCHLTNVSHYFMCEEAAAEIRELMLAGSLVSSAAPSTELMYCGCAVLCHRLYLQISCSFTGKWRNSALNPSQFQKFS